jgi:glucose-1-phosphate thymidylyltransferase
VIQEEMRGQSDAVYLARELLHGPMIVAYADTLLETSFEFLAHETNEAVAWVKSVPDPRRFGVAIEGSNGLVERLIEKPDSTENNLAVVGFYYFQRGEDVVAAIEEQMRRGIMLKDEYFLADAINILLENGLKMRTEQVDVWLDAGTPEAVLDTNRYLLEHGRATAPKQTQREGVGIIPPVFIHPSATIEASVVGPFVSVGEGSCISNSVLRNSILDECVQVTDSLLEDSILGRHVVVSGHATSLNLGDSSWAAMK